MVTFKVHIVSEILDSSTSGMNILYDIIFNFLVKLTVTDVKMESFEGLNYSSR